MNRRFLQLSRSTYALYIIHLALKRRLVYALSMCHLVCHGYYATSIAACLVPSCRQAGFCFTLYSQNTMRHSRVTSILYNIPIVTTKKNECRAKPASPTLIY